MSLLVVGSVALDTVQTPFGEAADAIGGSGVFFASAASLLHPVQLVGPKPQGLGPKPTHADSRAMHIIGMIIIMITNKSGRHREGRPDRAHGEPL